MSQKPAVSRAARAFVDGMRCIPFLLFAYIVYYGFPSIGINLDNWGAGLLALTIYNAAYMAEILRGAWVAHAARARSRPASPSAFPSSACFAASSCRRSCCRPGR